MVEWKLKKLKILRKPLTPLLSLKSRRSGRNVNGARFFWPKKNGGLIFFLTELYRVSEVKRSDDASDTLKVHDHFETDGVERA